MFDVISTAKNTQWLTYQTLNSKFTYPHVANEAVDFQIVPGKNCFAAFNKKFGFELLRTSNKDSKGVIQRVKKRQFADLSCGAISKLCGSEIAIGMTTGYIRIFSVQSGEYMPIKFKPNRNGNSVVDLDYSNTDEYLAAAYDSSDINLFNLKSGENVDTFRFKGQSTLVRFHPVREFVLAIGSYEGGVTIFDTQTKKKLYFDELAHGAPVRDISMFESHDVFVSCGYDSKINVYDLRRQAIVQQHKQSHPMSTVCVSSCGKFCVAGNLKGDVISYDFRTMKEPLSMKRVHDSAVIRVAFVPTMTSSPSTIHDSVVSTNSEFTTSLYKSASSASTSASTSHQSSGLESFSKLIDSSNKTSRVIAEDSTPKRRDSWADLMPVRKVHDFSMDSMAETPSRMSICGDLQSTSQLNLQSRFSLGQSSGSDQTPTEQKTLPELTIPEISISKPNEKKERHLIEPKRRRMTEIIALDTLEEESPEADRSHDCTQKKWLHNVDHKQFADGFAAYIKRVYETDNGVSKLDAYQEEDKENRQNNQQISKPVKAIEEPITHTPNRHTLGVPQPNKGETITVNADELNEMLSEILNEKMSILEAEFEIHLRKWQESVTAYMGTKLKELTSQVRYMQCRYFHSDFNHRYRSHMELETALDMFDEGFAALLHAESVENQYSVYSAELEDLRRRFHEQQRFNA